LAARLHMMNLQIIETSALLASPTIALNNPLTKCPMGSPVQAKSGSSGHGPSHDAFGIRSKNSCRCEFGSSK
jgi:hypothetical protein